MRFSLVRIAGTLTIAAGLYAQTQTPETTEAPAPKEASNESKGIPPRASPNDYQTHVQAGNVTVAADFLGHAVPREEGPLSTEDYVVVEAGLFGAQGEKLTLSVNDFSLRINGKKTALSGQPYGFVVSSLKDPEWSPPEAPGEKKSKTSFGSGGQGDSGPPPPVHVPIELQRAMAQHLQKSSMPEGDRPLPQAGLLYFEYRNRVKSIHSLELTYAGPAGKATMKLQP